MQQPLIHFKNADILNGENVVIYSLDLDIEPGDFVYIVGKVGSGKTSIIRTITAENRLLKGEGTACGYNLVGIKNRDIPFLRRSMGIVFQDFQLLTDRSVESNLEFVLRATGWKDRSLIDARITEVLEAVGKVIVAGHLNMNGGFSFLDKLQYLERVDLSRLNGDTYYRIWSGDGRNKTWKELLLPASIGEIRSKAFEGTNLESFTIFATTPPTIGLDNEGHQNAFPSSEGMAVYVPEEALTLYANTAGWKDFNLQPIQEDGADITVNIDAAGRIAGYQGMTLELKNVKSLYTRAMIITGRTAYTFPTLPKQTTYSIRLLSRTGSIVAHADNVYLDQENIEVTMGSLKGLCSLNLQVKEGNKDIGTDRYSCLWLNQQGNVIGRNTQQDGLIENEPVRALITLTDPALTATYVSSDTIMVTPDTSLSTVSYQLKPIPTHPPPHHRGAACRRKIYGTADGEGIHQQVGYW